jgi:hypothetical protein
MTEEAKTPHKPRTLYFVVRYNWGTKETKLAKYDENEDCKALYAEKLPEGVTLHRCEVELYPNPATDVVAQEIYCENDYVPATDITALDVLRRANPHRLFPILSGKNSINIGYSGVVEKPGERLRSQSYSVKFNDRSFRVTVDELPLLKPFDIRGHLLQQLDAIEKAPKMWGSLEAVELQYLLLLETFLLVDLKSPKEFMADYVKHCQRVCPGMRRMPYSSVTESHEELVEVLKSFRILLAVPPV